MDSIRPENFGSARGCDLIDSIKFYMNFCQNPYTTREILLHIVFAIFKQPLNAEDIIVQLFCTI